MNENCRTVMTKCAVKIQVNGEKRYAIETHTPSCQEFFCNNIGQRYLPCNINNRFLRNYPICLHATVVDWMLKYFLIIDIEQYHNFEWVFYKNWNYTNKTIQAIEGVVLCAFKNQNQKKFIIIIRFFISRTKTSGFRENNAMKYLPSYIYAILNYLYIVFNCCKLYSMANSFELFSINYIQLRTSFRTHTVISLDCQWLSLSNQTKKKQKKQELT